MKHKSILRNILLAFLGFGICMGIIFPFYAALFVDWKPGMLPWFVAGCLIASTIIGIANYLMLKWLLINKLTQIARVSRAISEKNLSFNCIIESHDVIGEIVDSFNEMTNTLRHVIDEIGNTSVDIEKSASTVNTISSNTHREVLAQYQQTQVISEQLNTLNSSVEEMHKLVNKTTISVQHATQEADEGNKVVQNSISVITDLESEIKQAASMVRQVEQDSEDIGSVLSVIQTISEQTNLLALNAAIEAARAGEQGRGFAVVADEVRLLAQHSSSATEKIQLTIEKLQKGSRSAAEAMLRGQEQAHHGVSQVSEAGDALVRIQHAVCEINDFNQSILQATDMQEELSQHMISSVGEIAQVAKNSSSSAEQTAQASNSLAVLGQQLTSLVAQFRLTKRLN